MRIKIKIDESKIEYHQPKSGFSKVLGTYIGRWFRKAAAVIPVNPPYSYKGIKGWFNRVKADEIGNAIKIEPKAIENDFNKHKERLKLYDFLSSTLYFLFATIIAIGLIVPVIYTISRTQSTFFGLLFVGSFNFIAILVGGFSALLAARIASILLDRLFADSLILPSSLYLIIDLHQHDDLANPDFKRNILERVHTLRRNTLLLSQTFTNTNLGENQKVIWQLRNIEFFILEREGWIIAPKKNTLTLLRKDFDKLGMLLISGRYGDFNSKGKFKIRDTTSAPLAFTDKLLQIIFFSFPYVMLLVLYIKPEYITNLGLNITTVFLLAIAWILLTIDAKLKLGFVERVTGLAKTMKELG